jgi:hypothetical protein
MLTYNKEPTESALYLCGGILGDIDTQYLLSENILDLACFLKALATGMEQELTLNKLQHVV